MTCIIAIASAASVPGSGCTNQSALRAVAVRTGSITTTVAPLRRASVTNGHRWRLVIRVLVPQRMMNLLWRRSIGSMPRPFPYARPVPTRAVAPQSEPTGWVAPIRVKNGMDNAPMDSRLWLPAELHGSTVSPPCVAIASPTRLPIRASASSHDARSNRPSPLGPTRTSGCSTRSGLYTRSR